MRVVDLFSGAGGFRLGLRSAGLVDVLCVDSSEAACATLRAAGAERVVCGDVGDVSIYQGIGPVDLAAAGPPCQGWSAAGRGLGAKDPRNGWPAFWRAVDALSPRWILTENVGPLEADPYWLEMMGEARERYAWADSRVIHLERWGSPARRARLVMVAGPCPIDWPQDSHGEPGAFFRWPWRTLPQMRGELGPTICTADGQYVGSKASREKLRRILGRPRFTRAEALEMQGFPADYPLRGTHREISRQIGNACPKVLGQRMGAAIRCADRRLVVAA